MIWRWDARPHFHGDSALPAKSVCSPPQVVCDPAKIVLRKSPGGCTHKYTTPSSWKGKVSRGEVGGCLYMCSIC